MATSGARSKSTPKPLVVALAGNPNSGKTTIFNALTGARQHVGNYPGVTVEKKEGFLRHQGREMRVVDLPGTYSLTAYSIEELVARNFVIDENPDVVVSIVDASNLERNLYLATQFMELGVPLVLAFNMSDVAKARGFDIDDKLLSKLMNVAIVRTVGHRGEGMDELKDAILQAAEDGAARKPAAIEYGDEIEREIAGIVPLLDGAAGLAESPGPRWLAVKLLEDDEEVRRKVAEGVQEPDKVFAAVTEAAHRIERDFGDTPDILVADRRYGFISGACQEAVKNTVEARHTMSDRIDAVVTSRALGIPIFLGMMYLVFTLTFTVGAPLEELFEDIIEGIGDRVGMLWPEGTESPLQSLVVDGIFGGVAEVFEFFPYILLLFLAIAFLEDSGYMARAAFIMDRLMHKIGLHGKSFIPMLIGFGCTVPAIMATRTLETKRDRLTSMLVLPLMSCSARIPIYALFIPAFFPQAWRAPMLWVIYIIGIVLAILLAKLLRSTLFRGEAAPFVMELPPYRMPTLKGTLIHMWERGWVFIRKAGTVIVGVTIVMWALTSYPKPPEGHLTGMDEQEAATAAVAYSVAGRIGHGLEPVMRPVGFDWKINTALVGAFAAKEVFVTQLGVVHALGDTDAGLSEALQERYTPLQAFCIMLFSLISIPCVVTIVVTWKESGSWKWAALQLAGLTVLAYVITLAVYQVGSLFV